MFFIRKLRFCQNTKFRRLSGMVAADSVYHSWSDLDMVYRPKSNDFADGRGIFVVGTATVSECKKGHHDHDEIIIMITRIIMIIIIVIIIDMIIVNTVTIIVMIMTINHHHDDHDDHGDQSS